MFAPIGIKTDYSLLQSLIKIKDLIDYANNSHLTCIGILDDNLSGSHYFYESCIKNNIKPIIGLLTYINNKKIYLYPKNYNGLSNLFRYSKYTINNSLSLEELDSYLSDVLLVLPPDSYDLYDKLKDKEIYLSYYDNNTEVRARTISKNIVYINETISLNINSCKYVNYLELIKKNGSLGDIEFKDYDNQVIKILDDVDTSKFTDLINIEFPKNKKYIPHFSNDIKNSSEYLKELANLGLKKRLNGKVTKEYQDRLNYELSVIDKMGFTDYFLIVFDYVRYAVKNDIYVGVGRGSAAGSLVAYALGITWIDSIKYNLLFERFLNPERVTMPDIDVDFEDEKREQVVDYVKEKYGEDNVGHILAYGTMTAREVIRVVGKINHVEDRILDNFCRKLNSKLSLKDNLNNDVKRFLEGNSALRKVYNEAYYLEGLKKHIGTHAAGVVISSVPLDTVTPILSNGEDYLIGYDKDELESLGLIKMDFLSIEKLTIMTNIVRDVNKYEDMNININTISLDDPKVYKLFQEGNTTGIFQFESEGMKAFLRKMKPTCFDDLYLANAIYRPGASDSLDEYLDRRHGKKKITYLDDSLKPILESTCGILIYQEQVMQILNLMGSYSYAEADIIRRAISKKKLSVIEDNRLKFINKAIDNGYSKNVATSVYEQIVKFAGFGFNKSHAVAYAMISYQMAYLKAYYEKHYFVNLLNNNSGEAKNREYINECKSLGIKFLSPDINYARESYFIDKEGIRIPFNVIKGVGRNISQSIINERENGLFTSFANFVARCYSGGIKKNILEVLIYAGCFDNLGYNKATLIKNLDDLIMYGDLVKTLDNSVSEPEIQEIDEYSDIDIISKQNELLGYYYSNHPSSKYPECAKAAYLNKYFDKIVKSVVLIERIRTIKTKTNEDMAFITGSDETGIMDIVVFPIAISQIAEIKVGDLVFINGRVEKRNDKYQLVVKQIKKQ